jgi:hypothetical protein
MQDLAADPAYADTLGRVSGYLIQEAWGSDLQWIEDGKLVGLPDKPFSPPPIRHLYGQRGWR